MAKDNRSFRLDKELLTAARAKKVKLTRLFEAALRQFLEKNRCPYCAQPIDCDARAFKTLHEAYYKESPT